MKNKIFQNKVSITIIVIISLILSFLSIFSFENLQWIWDTYDNIGYKIINTTTAISGILGVISIYLFAKKKDIAFLFAIINAVLYLVFCAFNGLVIEGMIQIIYMFIMLFTLTKQIINRKKQKTNKIPSYIISKLALPLIIIFFVIVFVCFYFINPQTNIFVQKYFYSDYLDFGSNFNYFIASSILLASSNAIAIVSLTLMTLGFKASWIIWCFKNVLAIIFFAGVAFLNVTLILNNIVYMSFSIYLFFLENNNKQLRLTLIGMGASGKSTLINNLRDFLDQNEIEILDERLDAKNKNVNRNLKQIPSFEDYMSDLFKYGFVMQKIFFKYRLEQIKSMNYKQRSLIDRHMIDDFLFPRVLIEMDYFSKTQKWLWKLFYEPFYKIALSVQPKVDFVFVILKNYDFILQNRKTAAKNHKNDKERIRRTIELKNDNFFRNANKRYLKNNQISNELCSLIKQYSKDHMVLIDEEWETSLPIIKNKIIELIKTKEHK